MYHGEVLVDADLFDPRCHLADDLGHLAGVDFATSSLSNDADRSIASPAVSPYLQISPPKGTLFIDSVRMPLKVSCDFMNFFTLSSVAYAIVRIPLCKQPCHLLQLSMHWIGIIILKCLMLIGK